MKVISLAEYRNEEFWNVLTHFTGVLLSILGIPFLFYFDNGATGLSTLALIMFSVGLLMVYSSSSTYHFVMDEKWKKRFQVVDHISIYYLILGSYAPLCLITLYHSSGLYIFFAVLALAVAGTVLKLFFTGKLEFLSVILYIAMGWLVMVDIGSIFELLSFNAKLLMVLGGVSYTSGIIFYAFDRIKYFHSIWHVFVLTGSVLHYLLVLIYII